jgi:hypothetical protein
MPFGVQIDVITSMANLEVFLLPPKYPRPPAVHPRGNFYQTDFPPLSWSVPRGPALLRPHPSGAPAGLTPAGLHLQEVKPSKNNGSERPSAFELAQKAFEARCMRSHEEGRAAS